MKVNANNKLNDKLLSKRNKCVDIYYVSDKGQYRVEAEMQDSVHHLRISMLVKEFSLKIEDIECEMVKVPDQICLRAQNTLKSLIGKKVLPGLTQGLNDFSPNEKCTHLMNLFHEACYNITLAESVYGKEIVKGLYPEITEEQMYKIFLWFKPDLKDSCARYSEESPFMQKVLKTSPPAGSEKLKALAQERLSK